MGFSQNMIIVHVLVECMDVFQQNSCTKILRFVHTLYEHQLQLALTLTFYKDRKLAQAFCFRMRSFLFCFIFQLNFVPACKYNAPISNVFGWTVHASIWNSNGFNSHGRKECFYLIGYLDAVKTAFIHWRSKRIKIMVDCHTAIKI